MSVVPSANDSSTSRSDTALEFAKQFATALVMHENSRAICREISNATTVERIHDIISSRNVDTLRAECVADRSGSQDTSVVKNVLFVGIKHDPDAETSEVPGACGRMLEQYPNLTVISENCPGYAHNTSEDATIDGMDDQFRSEPDRVVFVDIRQANVMGAVQTPLMYRTLMLGKIASAPYSEVAQKELKDAMIALISGAHDSISCLIASCDPDTPREKRRVPADGYAISNLLLKYDDELGNRWSNEWIQSIHENIKQKLRAYTNMCKCIDNLLEYLLKVVRSEDFFKGGSREATRKQVMGKFVNEFGSYLTDVYEKLKEYTNSIDPENDMKFLEDESAFMKMFKVHERFQPNNDQEVKYLNEVFRTLREVDVAQISDKDTTQVTWKRLLMWMYFVIFHISRIHEDDGPGENIFAEWLSHGAIDLMDGFIVRAILTANTENVLVVVGTTHVDSVTSLLKKTDKKVV
ncbi:hypothetical protein CYMTET_55174 [Cymbomonas tetramitiformis]|uniref:Uncharacterized protein n=1 Tax=Cymbomonas tetramitiformis TaxID=36881 RepID=A0AAE0ENN9_9CHLO|nr:hypothetical protein CYMTET_55174 [Cymbomonas tetramitiformis]|eukprot:gene119-171_t